MMTLDELVAQLEADVPAENGTPSEAQYARAVKDAVADFGRRAGRIKRTTLNIVSGTASYVLPMDFIKMVNLVGLFGQDGILNTPQGLIPLEAAYAEEYLVNGGVITFYPTPQYTMAREYRYKAGWALTEESGGDYYDDLTEDEAAIALMLARANATRHKADALGGGFNYRQGDVSVDTTGQAAELSGTVEKLSADYQAAVERYVGTVLVM